MSQHDGEIDDFLLGVNSGIVKASFSSQIEFSISTRLTSAASAIGFN
jgi:hypothetical protein